MVNYFPGKVINNFFYCSSVPDVFMTMFLDIKTRADESCVYNRIEVNFFFFVDFSEGHVFAFQGAGVVFL